MFLVEATRETRQDDIHIEFSNLNEALVWIAQNVMEDDGYRIIPFYEGVGTFREGSKAVLRVLGEETDSETIYDTLAEAETAVEALNASDGYAIIDLEQPVGSSPSLMVDFRPSLWQRHNENYTASRVNGWQRSDLDRL